MASPNCRPPGVRLRLAHEKRGVGTLVVGLAAWFVECMARQPRDRIIILITLLALLLLAREVMAVEWLS